MTKRGRKKLDTATASGKDREGPQTIGEDRAMHHKLQVVVAVGLAALMVMGSGYAIPQEKIGTGKSMTYAAQYRAAAELAGLLEKHFDGAAGLKISADLASNTLSITAQDADLEAVLKAARLLDRRPRQVSIDILLLQVGTKLGGDGKIVLHDVPLLKLSGPAENVRGNIAAMHKDGIITSVERHQLNTLENRPAEIKDVVNKPYVTGALSTVGPDGAARTTRTIAYKNVGDSVTVTPIIDQDRNITLLLQTNGSRAREAGEVPILAEQNGLRINSTKFIQRTLESIIAIPSGTAVLARAAQLMPSPPRLPGERTLMVVTADVGDGAAQQAKPDFQAGNHAAFVAEHRPVKDLASELAQQFKGDADLRVTADAASNTLLVAAKPQTLSEALKVLAKLDHRTQEVAMRILVLHITPRKTADGKFVAPLLDEKELSGPLDQVLGRIKLLETNGIIASTNSFEVQALENQTLKLSDKVTQPYPVAVVKIGGNLKGKANAAPSARLQVRYKDIGTTLKVTPRAAAERAISLDIRVEESRALQREDCKVLGNDENDQPVRETAFVDALLETKLDVAAGQAVLAGGVQMTSTLSGEQTLVIVSAELKR
jgi:type II secretory pathway component GspD/PulD (secretin)